MISALGSVSNRYSAFRQVLNIVRRLTSFMYLDALCTVVLYFYFLVFVREWNTFTKVR